MKTNQWVTTQSSQYKSERAEKMPHSYGYVVIGKLGKNSLLWMVCIDTLVRFFCYLQVNHFSFLFMFLTYVHFCWLRFFSMCVWLQHKKYFCIIFTLMIKLFGFWRINSYAHSHLPYCVLVRSKLGVGKNSSINKFIT